MNVTDYRIGNIVRASTQHKQDEDYFYLIAKIGDKKIEQLRFAKTSIVLNTDSKFYEVPVEITEMEIKRLGFKKPVGLTMKGYPYYVLDEQGLYYYNKNTKALSTHADGWRDIAKAKYVHQLQNIFYALTGEELPVKIK